MDKPPDWFWKLIDSTRPDLQRLETWLLSASREEIEQFAMAYEIAAESVGEYWAGPDVDGVQFSEDDTEDLCKWVVSQGQTFWESAISGEPSLVELARLYWRAEDGEIPELPNWTTEVANPQHEGYQSPEYIAYGVYESRFGESLSDKLSEFDY
jgi:hypothetical protein